jgi:uncharacterized phage protein (TIGR02218 family)
LKDLSVALLAHLAQSVTTLAEGWRVIRPDNTIYGFTSHDVSVTIDGVTYGASPGLQATASHTTDKMAVDTLDVTVFLTVADEADIAAGLWDNSVVTVFEYNWASPPTTLDTNVLILRHGNLGEVKRQNNLLNAEIRGLVQRLSRRIGRQYLPTCPWRHAQWKASEHTFVSSVECGVDLTTFIATGAVTSLGADPTLEFSDSDSARVDAYYNEGLIHFTTGSNTGITREVAAWVGKAYRLHRPLPYAAVIGDAYVGVRGDDKLWETCKGVYANWLQFGGFPALPGIAAVWQNPTGA